MPLEQQSQQKTGHHPGYRAVGKADAVTARFAQFLAGCVNLAGALAAGSKFHPPTMPKRTTGGKP